MLRITLLAHARRTRVVNLSKEIKDMDVWEVTQ